MPRPSEPAPQSAEPPEPPQSSKSPQSDRGRGPRDAARPTPGVVDPDVDLHVPSQRRELRDAPWTVLAAVSAGGALGGAARSAVGLLLPHHQGQFPWSTIAVNASGCLLIGVLMTVVVRARPESRLLRPFAGVGVLGGYTTFSAHVADAHALLTGTAPAMALASVGATLLFGLAAVWAGVALTERLLSRRNGRDRPGRSAAQNAPDGQGRS